MCLVLCISEIVSCLPFAGGSYGLVRVTIGFYPAFIIGCCETIEYIFYVATSAISLGAMICQVFSLDGSYAPYIYLVFYVVAVGIQLQGGKVFWSVNEMLAVVSIGVLLVYVFGGFKYVDMAKYGAYVVTDDSVSSVSNEWFVGDFTSFALVYPLACWFYVGVESLVFASDLLADPKKSVSWGSTSCMMTLGATSILVLCVCSALSPGVYGTSSSASPLNSGFSMILGISNDAATILSIPATFATAYAFIFPYGKLICGMAESNLLPRVLSRSFTSSSSKVPGVAIVVGSLIGYGVCLIVYFYPFISSYIFNICILCGMMTYVSQCYGYYKLRTKFKSLPRDFRSPLGVYGAAYAALAFGFGMITVIAFQEDHQVAFISVLTVICLASFYYFVFARKTQSFSDEELKITFYSHIVNYNLRIRSQIRRGALGQSGIFSNYFVRRIASDQKQFSVERNSLEVTPITSPLSVKGMGHIFGFSPNTSVKVRFDSNSLNDPSTSGKFSLANINPSIVLEKMT